MPSHSSVVQDRVAGQGAGQGRDRVRDRVAGQAGGVAGQGAADGTRDRVPPAAGIHYWETFNRTIYTTHTA